MKYIILAGALSNALKDLYPKQSLMFFDGQSLVFNIYKLLLSLTDEKNILIVSNEKISDNIKNELHNISKNPLIISEPLSKNTLSAVLSSLYFLKGNKDETVVILPSDFFVKSVDNFKEALENAKLAAKKGYIAALGVKFSYFDCNFGYIKTGKSEKSVTPVLKFVEKPDNSMAEEFSKNYYQNCGIYVSKLSVLLNEIFKHAPQTAQYFSKDMFDENNKIIYEYYEELPEISLEYAVMEKTDKLAFIELKTKWFDYGSWHGIYNNSTKSSQGNVLKGNIITNNVKNSFVYSEKEVTAVSYAEDMIIADTKEALIVYNKNRACEIEELVKKVQKHCDKTIQIKKTTTADWGSYTCLNQKKDWTIKIITVFPGQQLSLQIDSHKNLHWIVLSGIANVILNNKSINLKKGTSINILRNSKYSIQNNTKDTLKILEVQKIDE